MAIDGKRSLLMLRTIFRRQQLKRLSWKQSLAF
jgi:hypothetical protein